MFQSLCVRAGRWRLEWDGERMKMVDLRDERCQWRQWRRQTDVRQVPAGHGRRHSTSSRGSRPQPIPMALPTKCCSGEVSNPTASKADVIAGMLQTQVRVCAFPDQIYTPRTGTQPDPPRTVITPPNQPFYNKSHTLTLIWSGTETAGSCVLPQMSHELDLIKLTCYEQASCQCLSRSLSSGSTSKNIR